MTTPPAQDRAGRRLARRSRESHVPLSVSIELTRRCNMRCVHCYVGPAGGEAPGELTTRDWLTLIDELAEAGTLFLLLTGGEPLLHRDFEKIYLHAKRKGLVVTVFTNATCVTERIVELLRDWPPRDVDITLYGATPQTYEAVTGIPGSFDRCLRGIDMLKRAGVRVTLKTMLLTLNAHEFPEIEALGARYGDPQHFRIDASVHARLDGDGVPLQYRVDPETAAQSEMLNADRAGKWCTLFETARPVSEQDGRMFLCGAGRNLCHIDARGYLKPCLLHTGAGYNLREGSFEDGWTQFIPGEIAEPFRDSDRCRTCESKDWCGYCPERLALDTGSRHQSSDWMCRLARARQAAARKSSKTE